MLPIDFGVLSWSTLPLLRSSFYSGSCFDLISGKSFLERLSELQFIRQKKTGSVRQAGSPL
jgi:hypothetical protein